MTNSKYPINIHDKYHAHVYFDETSLDLASDLHKQVAENFALPVGRIHQKPVGPHTKWSFQILFGQNDFDEVVPWLDAHRGDLSVLVHADTGNDAIDHTEYAYWLGEAVKINLNGF
ncbi:DOPA 4,5-dioxygenase family protein [Thalassotalea sp. Y01]|nr:DOPA 4,5-dioxygenase family protein [Thalassotalea sp. Y01]